MKKLSAIFLTVALLLSCAAFTPASAIQMEGDQTFGHITEFNSDFESRYPGALDTLANGIYNLETSTDLSRYNIEINDAKTMYTIVIHTHPELFYVSSAYSYSYFPRNGKYYLYSFNLHWGKPLYDEYGNQMTDSNGRPLETTYTDAQVLSMRAEFRARAQWFLDLVDDSMSDFQKALILHDALVLNARYLITGETYDLMVNGEGKCYGYSECYSYLLAHCGINSEIVESDEMFHQWNKVEIDGVYYHVDVTWDDPVYPPDDDRIGFAEHTFFLLSDNAAENNANHPHTGFVSEYPSNDTRYDNKRYHDIDTRFCFAGGNAYAVVNDRSQGNEAGGKLVTYDVSTDTFTEAANFENEFWRSPGGGYYIDMYMALDEHDGYLYMNSQSSIYVYDTATNQLDIFGTRTGVNFIGVRVIGGKVYAVTGSSMIQQGELLYIGDCLVRAADTLYGDMDGNGSLTVTDVTALQRILAEFEDFTDGQLEAADVNGDNDIDVRDVTAIQRIIAELV